MEKDKIHLLVTIDKNYMMPFRVMLKSFIINNPQEAVHIWLLHSNIPQDDLNLLTEYCNTQRVTLTPIQVDRAIFKDAPISKRYPQEMYYRLLAPVILPDSVERILYLDPDILVTNSVRPLWETQLGKCAFAAAAHSVVPDMVEDVNKIRLRAYPQIAKGVQGKDLRQ